MWIMSRLKRGKGAGRSVAQPRVRDSGRGTNHGEHTTDEKEDQENIHGIVNLEKLNFAKRQGIKFYTYCTRQIKSIL